MPITLGTSITSLKALRQLGQSTDSLSRVYERLSSGQRINRASDDAAGLAIATSLNVSARVLLQGVRNINDAVSATSIAEGALGALRDISIRQKELAEQAASGTYSYAQRQAINTEANSLVNEFNRITESTTFNGMSLLDPNLGSILIQVGYSSIAAEFSDGLKRVVGDGTFQAQSPVSTGLVPNAVVLADLNGDGRLDLLSVDNGSNQVSFFLGNGDGTFQAQRTLATGVTPRSISAVDINGDGKLDIITTDQGSDQVSIFLGNGDGTFKAQRTASTGGSPWSLTTGDMNGDGRIDLVTADYGSGQIGILLGNGDGTFQTRRTAPGSALFTGVTVGDVNDDGRLDIVSADYTSATTSIFLGNGDGTFQARRTITNANKPVSVSLADINNDGRIDIVSSNRNGNVANVFLGNGNGTFQARRSLATGTDPESISIGDINGDGRLDIITADLGSDQVSIFLGNADGTFRARRTASTTTGSHPTSAILGDLNGDGRLDIVTANYGNNHSSIFLANGGYVTTSQVLNLNTQQLARDAMTIIDGNLDRVMKQIGLLGATSSRFQSALNTLQSSRENYLAASSRIQDADIASETAELVRKQIIQQAASAVLAQANQQPALALKLLA